MSELKLADQLWLLYKQHKSLRKVAKIAGISHDSVRRYLSNAGYDTNLVNPRIINDTQSIQARIRAEDEEMLRELLNSGSLLGTMSSQILIAVQQYCDRIRESQKQCKCLSASAAVTNSKNRSNGTLTIYDK